MGDLFRQACKLMARAAQKMALPALIASGFIVILYRPSGMMEDRWMLLMLILVTYIILTLGCYMQMETDARYKIQRIDGEIVGREFGGMRKKDRMFCRALRSLADDELMDAVELFGELAEMKLTQNESRLVHFYLGRCYQVTDCPSNAVIHYQQAKEEGLQTDFLDLFLARSYTDGGRYDEAFAVYRELLARENVQFTCVRTDIGMMYLRKHDGEQALRWFEESIAKSQNYAFALGGCSLAYLLCGDMERSQHYYEQAITNNMNDAEGFQRFHKELSEVVALRNPANK